MERISENNVVKEVVAKIANICDIKKMMVFSHKTNIAGELSSFKLCVICNCADKHRVEKDIYINVDSPLPFDVVVYTNEEWAKLTEQKDSFATKVDRTGCVVYG